MKQRTEPGSAMLTKHRIKHSSYQYESKHILFKGQDSWTRLHFLVQVLNNYTSISLRNINTVVEHLCNIQVYLQTLLSCLYIQQFLHRFLVLRHVTFCFTFVFQCSDWVSVILHHFRCQQLFPSDITDILCGFYSKQGVQGILLRATVFPDILFHVFLRLLTLPLLSFLKENTQP